MAAATPGPRGAVRWLDALRLACAIGLAFAESAAGVRAADVPSTGALAAHGFDDAMSARVLAHGPWPPPPARDPSNRASGAPAAIALGRLLFGDRGLAAEGGPACASCHDATRRYTDGRARARGLADHDRNTLGLENAWMQRWFGWDGGADSLWAATIRPLLAPGEMGSDATRVAERIRGEPRLSAAWVAAYGAPPAPGPQADEAMLVDAAKAIAAWMETLTSPRTRFDDFRDALARGDARGIARYPAAALRGLRIFVGRGNCHACHFGPNFSNGEFHDVGRPFLLASGRVDPGRHAGLRRVRGDRFNLLGRYNDARDGGAAALKTGTVSAQHRNWGEWRTPGLRGLAASAPYMHDGSLPTLREVIRHYSELDEDRLHTEGEALLRPLRLSAREIDDLLAFLATLEPDQ